MNELTPEARAILRAHKKAFLQGQLSMLAILEKSFDDEDWRRRVSMAFMFRLAPRRMIRRFWEKKLAEQEQLLCETQDRQSVPFAPAIIQVKWKEEQERKGAAMNGSSKEAFYACCREAFYAWWKKEADGFIGFVDQEDAAFHAWVAALEWAQAQATQTKKDFPIDDLDEFSVYWWGPDVDGENSLAEAIESGRMGEFARAVLGHSPLTPAEIQLLKEGKCMQVGDYKIQLNGDFTTDAILRIAASLKGESPTYGERR